MGEELNVDWLRAGRIAVAAPAAVVAAVSDLTAGERAGLLAEGWTPQAGMMRVQDLGTAEGYRNYELFARGVPAGVVDVTTQAVTTPHPSFFMVQSLSSVSLPKLQLQANGVTLTSGQATPIDFGTIAAGSNAAKAFVVRNSGSTPLNLGELTLPNGYTLTGALPPTLAPSESAGFSVSLGGATAGTFAGNLTLRSSDGTQSPFTAPLTGTVNAPPALGSIAGTVFTDTDGDGTKDLDETVAGGTTVYLDANNDGKLTEGETAVASDEAGHYAFSRLSAGTYRVRAVLASGLTQTTPAATTVAAGQDLVDVNVGVRSIGDDPVSVTLEAEAGTMTGGTHLAFANAGYTGTGYADYDASGSAVRFDFSRVKAGPVTLTFRYANGGTTDRPLAITVNGVAAGALSFPSTGGWATWKTVSMAVNLTAGVNAVTATAGPASGANVDNLSIGTPVAPPVTGTISGFCFDDSDKDGIYDPGETKTGGKTVFLDVDNDGVLDSTEKKTTTLADGSWSFTGLSAGTYRVRRVFSSGYVQSNAPSDVTLAAGQVVSGLALGSKPGSITPTNTASIAGSVFNDNNKNGKYDTGDGYAKGVVVFLDSDNDGKLDSGETSVTTDSSGKFGFTKLAAGTYRVRRVMPSGYTYSTTKPDVTLTSGQAKSGVVIGTKRV